MLVLEIGNMCKIIETYSTERAVAFLICRLNPDTFLGIPQQHFNALAEIIKWSFKSSGKKNDKVGTFGFQD